MVQFGNNLVEFCFSGSGAGGQGGAPPPLVLRVSGLKGKMSPHLTKWILAVTVFILTGRPGDSDRCRHLLVRTATIWLPYRVGGPPLPPPTPPPPHPPLQACPPSGQCSSLCTANSRLLLYPPLFVVALKGYFVKFLFWWIGSSHILEYRGHSIM